MLTIQKSAITIKRTKKDDEEFRNSREYDS